MATDKQIKEQIKKQVDGLSRLAFGVDMDVDEGKLHQVSLALAKLDDDLREAVQSETANKMTEVIGKLKNDRRISAEDLALIRLWMVSDAEFYVQLENDFQNWISEINRLFSHINSLNQGELDLKTMGQISGSIRDALRVIADVVYFRQEEQRIHRFERATQTLYSEDKQHLARLLRRKLRSSDV